MGGLEKRALKKGPRQPKRKADALQAKKPADRKWEKKMKVREREQKVRQLSKLLKDDLNAEQKRVHEARRANEKRKQENERKNMVVQTIKNDKAMKKLSPKHRHKARIFMLHELN